MINYWGARRTAFRILLIFGAAVGLFNVVSDLADPVAMVMQLLVTTLPFFLFAFLSRRWPRVAGALMVAVSVVAVSVVAVGYYFGHFPRLVLIVKACTVVLVTGPLLASGLALLVRSEQGREPQGA